MRASARRKLNALRMMVASGVIRAAYSKHDEFIHREHQVRTENPAAEFDHLAPFNVLSAHHSIGLWQQSRFSLCNPAIDHSLKYQ